MHLDIAMAIDRAIGPKLDPHFSVRLGISTVVAVRFSRNRIPLQLESALTIGR